MFLCANKFLCISMHKSCLYCMKIYVYMHVDPGGDDFAMGQLDP